jgi:trigger factor
MGLESLDQLRQLLKGQVEQELNGLTRTHMKRRLLDQLAASHDFDVPPSMVEAEFGQIWQQLEQEASREDDPEAARAEMESERDEYRGIAERRVRLGLLLSEIGRQNAIDVNQNEMNQIVMQAAQQYRPEDRQRFIEYVRNDPMAAAQLRAPLFEDKVVDYLFEKAEIAERVVSRDTLQSEIESADTGHVHGPDCDHGHDHGKPKGRKAAAKGGKQAKAEEPAAKPAKAAKAAKADAPAVEKPAKAVPSKAEGAKKAAASEASAPADEAPAAKPAKGKKKGAAAE